MPSRQDDVCVWTRPARHMTVYLYEVDALPVGGTQLYEPLQYIAEPEEKSFCKFEDDEFVVRVA